MTARAAARPTVRARARQQAAARRRRIGLLLLVVAGFSALAVVAYGPGAATKVQELALPLRHEDVIRQQAREKGLDPALIAAVIFAESRFRDDARSSAGAIGLMQLTPPTAKDIAKRSGGTAFVLDDLDTPQVNISYGSWYLRYLLDRYGGNTMLAVAAYNGGEGNVDRWVHDARDEDRRFTVDRIPFPETRLYTRKVLAAQADYRSTHADALGL